MNQGDRVRVVDKGSPDYGREGVVLDATDTGYVVQIDGEDFPRFYFTRQLELIEEETE